MGAKVSASFVAVINTDGVAISLITRRMLGTRPTPLDQWNAPGAAPEAPLRYLNRLIADGSVQTDSTSIFVPNSVLVDVPGSLARQIGLPETTNLALGLKLVGRVETPDGLIALDWTDGNGRRVTPTRRGLFVASSSGETRLTGPLFRIVEAVEGYNSTRGQTMEQRLPRWAIVQGELEKLTGDTFKAETLLKSFRIRQAGAFALDIRQALDGPVFDVVLMSASKRASLDDLTASPEGGLPDIDEGDLKDNGADALLPPIEQREFVATFSSHVSPTGPAYIVGRNSYLVIEPDLRRVLDVVKRMQRSDGATRKAFLRNPRSAIAEALPDAGEELGTIFVETQQYSERVKGLGIWNKPKLDWLIRKPNGWLPERFILQLGDRAVEMDEGSLQDLATALQTAQSKAETSITYRGETFSVDEVESAIGDLGESEMPPPTFDRQAEVAASVKDGNVLLLDDNVDEAAYVATWHERQLFAQKLFPEDLLKSSPMLHQRAGFGWLVDAWIAGMPGALLADDMGLGKTMQALAFLAWFRSNRAAGGARADKFSGPILIVAPTALLKNWQKEADIHLTPDALGYCIEVFGSGLKRLKVKLPSSPEDALQVELLRSADWILTTYETLATYHRAFARVAYSVVIFDEMQKIKAPDTINTHAAKVINADFVLGMTGTPIENRIEDIWCVMDRVAPGHLGGLKAFSATYGSEDETQLKALKAKLDQPTGKTPAMMLRRMKTDHLKGLPERTIETYRVPMPQAQADAYRQVVLAAKGAGRTKGDMLKTIHALRGVSLHPHGAEAFDPYSAPEAAAWVASSARVSKVISILESIRDSGEKALVFIEDRAVQSAFAAVVANHFKLRAEPDIINGELAGDRRQDVVDRFQALPAGFAVLVLSPKAAGIGLTITAANHVIHLSRWWNPAVEDQCNDRCYRIGQQRKVTVHIPLAEHPDFADSSFDIRLDQLLARKRSLSRDMLAPPVSEGDVASLFEDAIANAEG